MTKNKHTTTTPTNPLAAPAKEKLPAAAFFRVILGDDPLPAAEDVLPFQPGPDPLRLFADYDTRPLWLVHMGSTLFCHAWHGLVQTAEQRSRNGHQVAGGKAHPLGLQPDDLAQEPFPEGPLTLTPWGLCLRLLADLPVLVRLIRAARRWHARKRLTWKGYFEAAGVVGLRLLRVEQALWEQTDPWFSEVCLRWALRETWKALFGPSVRVPAELKYWFKPLAMTVEQERALLRRLAPAGKLAQAVVPPPFAGVVARWQSGDLPEEVLSDAPLAPAQARCVRAYV